MEHTGDVERLFSWLKAPMVRYREFTPQTEVADAVATWPSVYRAAVQTGVAGADEIAPQGDIAAKERIARERRTLPAAAAPPPAAPTAGRAGDQPADEPLGQPEEQLAAALGQRVQAARAEPAGALTEAAPQVMPREIEPMIEGFEPPPAPAREPPAVRAQPYDGEVSGATRHYPARERGALFGGEYRGREREAGPRNRVAGRQDRSLDAVFSRLSGARDRLPDPRERARTTPGLGTVFGRLR